MGEGHLALSIHEPATSLLHEIRSGDADCRVAVTDSQETLIIDSPSSPSAAAPTTSSGSGYPSPMQRRTTSQERKTSAASDRVAVSSPTSRHAQGGGGSFSSSKSSSSATATVGQTLERPKVNSALHDASIFPLTSKSNLATYSCDVRLASGPDIYIYVYLYSRLFAFPSSRKIRSMFAVCDRLRLTYLGHKHGSPSFPNRCRRRVARRLHPQP
jgi:hypothetical protein